MDWAISQIEREYRWLPTLAPHLPLAIPVPLAMGEPGEGYPWHWSVNPWLPGENATIDRVDPAQFTRAILRPYHCIERSTRPADRWQYPECLARRSTDPTQRLDPHGPARARNAQPDRHPTGNRSLGDRAGRPGLGSAASLVPRRPPFRQPAGLQRPPQCRHRLRLLPASIPRRRPPPTAWTLLSASSREVFRTALQADDASWSRGRGWALSFAAGALAYYHRTNPSLAGISRYAIDQVLADHRQRGY
ncbi:MAG: hypothetical protein R3A46_04025 [Thermomicrobiales bacterium]